MRPGSASAAVTVNKVCGSGLKAVMMAAQAIKAGDINCAVAGGMESMSNAPFLMQGVRTGYKFGDQEMIDAMINDGLWCSFADRPMGNAFPKVPTRSRRTGLSGSGISTEAIPSAERERKSVWPLNSISLARPGRGSEATSVSVIRSTTDRPNRPFATRR